MNLTSRLESAPAPARNPTLILTLLAVVALSACSREPQLEVRTADAAANPPAAQASAGSAMAPIPAHASQPTAPPLAEGATLPADHPPLGMPGDHPPLDPAAAAATVLAPVAPGAGTGSTALAWSAPAGWTSETPSNSMRRAQYKVPGPGGDGECAVFYFGPGQGGDPQSNAERWAAQFVDGVGNPAVGSMKTRTGKVGEIDVLFVEARGTYQSGSMMGMGGGTSKPGWALLGAIATGPDANWFFKLTAPETTIEAQRKSFDEMIASLKRGG